MYKTNKTLRTLANVRKMIGCFASRASGTLCASAQTFFSHSCALTGGSRLAHYRLVVS